jgi:hypothetical protein
MQRGTDGPAPVLKHDHAKEDPTISPARRASCPSPDIAVCLTGSRSPLAACSSRRTAAEKSACTVGQIKFTFPAVSAWPQRGVSRSSRTLGGDAVGASVCSVTCHADEQTDATAKSCGPGIPTLMPSL